MQCHGSIFFSGCTLYAMPFFQAKYIVPGLVCNVCNDTYAIRLKLYICNARYGPDLKEWHCLQDQVLLGLVCNAIVSIFSVNSSS